MVYVIQAGEQGPFKIGHVRGGRGEVAQRRTALQCGCPEELIVRAVVPGGIEIEELLHRFFERYRVRGEWFSIAAGGWLRFENPDLALILTISDAMMWEMGYDHLRAGLPEEWRDRVEGVAAA